MSNTVEDDSEGRGWLGVREEGKVPPQGRYSDWVLEGRFCKEETGVGKACKKALRHKNSVFREKQMFNVAATWMLE